MLKRGRVLILSACLALALLAGTWVSAMPTGTSMPTPSPDDFPMTVTAYWAGVTATAQANATFYGLMSPTPTSGIDPIYMTATYIVGRATQTEAAYMTVTAGGSLPAAFPTPTTLMPTLNAEDETDLLKQWTTELEAATGFSHPIFGSIAYDFLKDFQFSIQMRNKYPYYPIVQEIKPVVTHTKYGGNEYVVLVTRLPAVSIATLWVFRMMDRNPILLSGDLPFDLGEVYGDINPTWYTFKDLNKNGLPDLVVGYNSGGNCPSGWFGLLEIQRDGNIINVAKAIPENGRREPGTVDSNFYDSIISFDTIDVNNDGTPEIKVVGKYFDYPSQPHMGCSFLPMVRYYGWDGKTYQDITATLDESAYPDVEAYFEGIKNPGCLLPDSMMNQVIVDYFVLGRLKDGWARLAPQLHWELCSPEALVQNGETMGKTLAWVGTLLDLEQQNHHNTSP